MRCNFYTTVSLEHCTAALRLFAVILLLNLFVLPSQFTIHASEKEDLPLSMDQVENPRLVVGIVIEKMRYDYLVRMWNRFGKNGFKKIASEGAFCRNATYDYLHNQSSPGYATIFTGANPSEHGIISNEWYQRLKRTTLKSDHDETARAVGGTFNEGGRSPVNLMSETIGDIIKKANDFRSRVFTVSMNSPGAVISGGFSADAAWWFDKKTGEWMSSTYYIDSMPQWVYEFNRKRLPESYLERTWKPLPAFGEYFSIESEKNISGSQTFEYDLKRESRGDDNYNLLARTPYGNTFTKDFALSLILNEELGAGENIDMVVIGFSAAAEIGNTHGVFSPEAQDAYLRLDAEIAHLLQFLDQNFEKEEILLFITSDQGASYPREYFNASRIPTGTFSQGAAMALLRSYLNATYGEGDWVLGYHARQVYLNRLLAEDSNIPLGDIQMKSAAFLDQVSGVSRTFTAHMLMSNYYTSGPGAAVQEGFNTKRSGDIIISLRPGWEERSVTEDPSGMPVTDSHVPLMWYGGGVNKTEVNRPVSITDIAPTISFMLNTPYGNSFSGQPIMEIIR